MHASRTLDKRGNFIKYSIYSKRTLLREFSGEHAPILLTSAQEYLIYIHERSGVVGRERMGTAFHKINFERYLYIIAINSIQPVNYLGEGFHVTPPPPCVSR